MTIPHSRRGAGRPPARGPAAILVGLLVVLGSGLLARDAAGQELSLKREIPPPEEVAPCAQVTVAQGEPTAEDRDEAERLRGAAARSMILGETAEALELLEEALRLDPTSAPLHFEIGRVLDDIGREEDALEAFCGYLALDPGGPESEDAEARVERLAPEVEQPIPDAARRAFHDGVTMYDAGDHALAVREFSRALVELPEWADAHYNRALAYLGAGRDGAATSDFEQYLELEPRSADAHLVRQFLEDFVPAAPMYSPAAALAVGMLAPGMGHFYSGRTGMGALYLLGAGASAAAGLFYTEVEVDCLSVPGPDGCPSDDILERRENQPLLIPGVAGAVGLTVAGAIHAYFSTREMRSEVTRTSAIELGLPGRGAARLRLDPTLERGGVGFRAALRITH